jgi:CheY-specific phosphatase CheX
MTAAISEVLETMFFTIIETGEENPGNWHFFCQSSISLTSPEQQLELLFRTTEPFARSITANLLGRPEEEVMPEEMEDALKEVANMVGGNFAARVEESDLRLGIPGFRKLSGGETGSENAIGSLPLFTDGEPAGMVLLTSL